MEGVNTFLKVVLFQVDVSVSVELLKDLIKPYGPISREELVEVVVRWDIGGCLDHEEFKQYVKEGRKLRRGKSILHSAVEDGKANVTKKLCTISEAEEFTIDEPDEEDNTVFHLAAKSGRRETVRALLPRYFTSVSTRKPSVSKKPSVSSMESIDLTILDLCNQVGDTPLAIAAREGHFAIVLSLLLVDANPNIASHTTGCTPLHLAASGGYVDIVKALLVFGAEMRLKNKAGQTPGDQASVHPQVLEVFSKLEEAIKAGKIPTVEKQLPITDRSGPFLLCMDGGGMRGLATCIILREVEDCIRNVDPNFQNLASYFDYITGTSIGSYVAFSMVYREMPVKDIIKLFFEFKDNLLTGRRPYVEHIVNDVLKQLFTENTVMSDVTEPKVMALTCKANMSPPTLHIMRNTGEARNGEKGPKELKIWEAARASSAAPTYFPPFGHFLDGGILSNNPTVDCIREVIDDLDAEGRDPHLDLVVSIGTGNSPYTEAGPIKINSISKPSDIINAAVGVKNFLKLILDQMTFSGGSQLECSRAWCKSMQCPFFRLDPELKFHVDLAENNEGVLVDLMFESLLFAKREHQQIKAVAKILLSRPPRNLKS
jgi:calcium-independent phospholipase A2